MKGKTEIFQSSFQRTESIWDFYGAQIVDPKPSGIYLRQRLPPKSATVLHKLDPAEERCLIQWELGSQKHQFESTWPPQTPHFGAGEVRVSKPVVNALPPQPHPEELAAQRCRTCTTATSPQLGGILVAQPLPVVSPVFVVVIEGCCFNEIGLHDRRGFRWIIA